MKARLYEQLIAESEATIALDGYVYFPRESVRMDLLRASPKTPDDLECPHSVQFYDIALDNTTTPRAAWSYESPRDSMTHLADWIGFWGDVDVT